MRARFLGAAAMAALALFAAGCGGGNETGGEAEQAATADPEAPEGIAVSDARMMLPAVPGNPAAIYFTIANTSDRPIAISGVSVQGADSAMLHTTTVGPQGTSTMGEMAQQAVPAGETVRFEPGGRHVMAGGLADTVRPGGVVEVTLTFTGGDKVSFPAAVRAAGDER